MFPPWESILWVRRTSQVFEDGHEHIGVVRRGSVRTVALKGPETAERIQGLDWSDGSENGEEG